LRLADRAGLLGEALLAGLVAAGGVVAVRLALRARGDAPLAGPTLPGVAPAWALAVLAVVVAGYAVSGRRYARPATAALAGAAAALLTVPLTLGVWGSDQPLNGVLGGDNPFRTEYVTRFATTWALQDYMFAGKHAFYPPAWFWVAGRWAAAVGEEPYRILQPMTVATQAASLLAAFVLWRLTTRPAVALAAAVGSSLLVKEAAVTGGTYTAWVSPYSAVVAVVVVPWFVAARGWAGDPQGRRGRAVLLAATGAVLALTYYLLFVIAAAALLAAALRGLVRALVLLAGVAALTAVFWVPFVADVLSGQPTQGTFFHPALLEVNTGVEIGGVTALLTVAAAVLLLLAHATPAGRALLVLAVAAIGYQALSALMLALAQQHLQPQRAATMLLALIGAAVPVGLDALDVPLRERARPVVAGVLALALFSTGVAFATPLLGGDMVAAAHAPFDPGPANALERAIVDTAGRPADEVVVASADRVLVTVHPFWSFLPWNIHYAHPAAQVPERVRFLRQAAACPDAGCFDAALAASPFGPVDAFVLRPDRRTLALDTQLPGFPEPAGVTISLRPELFDAARWARADLAGYAVYVRRPSESGRP
jgi:galactan 5-O-arabinofuranosyltransferase